MNAQLLGMDWGTFERDGKTVSYCRLYLMHQYDERAQENDPEQGFVGRKVERESCPRKLDFRRLEVGRWYEMVYDIRDTRDGKKAYLVDLVPLDGNPETGEAAA